MYSLYKVSYLVRVVKFLVYQFKILVKNETCSSTTKICPMLDKCLIQELFCAPGSMPPNSHSIFDEGAVFMSFKLVDNGIFQEGGNVPCPDEMLSIAIFALFCLS